MKFTFKNEPSLNVDVSFIDIYVVSVTEFQYNDEYYYPEGSSPFKYCSSEFDAKNYCNSRNTDLVLENDYRTGVDVAYTHSNNARWDWYFENVLGKDPLVGDYEPYDVWEYSDFSWTDMILWVAQNNKDLYDYLPGVFIYSKIEHI